jgi:L-fuconolactonase
MRESGYVGWSAYLPEDGPTLSDWSADRLSALRGGILSLNATPSALARAADTVSALDETAVLVSHLGLPGAGVRGADAAAVRERLAPLLSLAARSHVAVKLSGLYAIDPQYPHPGAVEAVDAVLAAFGPHRVAWGSDFSPVTSTVEPSDAMELPEWILEGLSCDETDGLVRAPTRKQHSTVARAPWAQPLCTRPRGRDLEVDGV